MCKNPSDRKTELIVKIRNTIFGPGLWALAAGASALSLGNGSGTVVLGSPVDLSFELQPDPGTDVASSCVTAKLVAGDNAISDIDPPRRNSADDASEATSSQVRNPRPSRIVHPGTPASSISRLLPAPKIRYDEIPSTRNRRSSACSSARDCGSARNSIAPPTAYVVTSLPSTPRRATGSALAITNWPLKRDAVRPRPTRAA